MATNVTMPDNMTMFANGGAAASGAAGDGAVSGVGKNGAAGVASGNGSKMLKVAERGGTVEADGNAAEAAAHSASGAPLPQDLGANNERLADVAPQLVNALRELVVQYRTEGLAARRHEIRRIRQARLFWQGLQYAWWNPQDMSWHLPTEAKIHDASALEDMPRYQFVTNLYQAFGFRSSR